MRLTTERLELVVGTPEMFVPDADLASLLDCEVPASWPFPNVADHLEVFRDMAQKHPEWAPWFFVATDGPRRLVGDGGFYGPPEDGFLTIGYEIDVAEWNKGYATEAVKALCQWAFERAEVGAVEAQTERDNPASQRVLAKAGFKPGGVDEDGFLLSTLTRSDLPD